MKNFLILVILLGLGYFAYQSFIQTDAVNQESYRDRSIRESGLEDLAGGLPKDSSSALVEAKGETDSFFGDIQIKLNTLRSDIKLYINEKL